MGWWDEGILGGDTPLDAVGELEKVVGWDYQKDDFLHDANSEDALPRLLAKKTEITKLLQEKAKDDHEMSRGAVLGIVHVLIQHGFPINKTIEKIARKAADEDEWANEERCREKVVQDFLVSLSEATGRKVKEKEYRIKVVRKTRAHHTFKVKAKSRAQAEKVVEKLAKTHNFTGVVYDFDYE